MLDWLKTILGDAYTEDIDSKVSAEIGKNFVAKTDFNATNEAKKTAEAALKERDKQLETLKASNGDAEALKATTALMIVTPKEVEESYAELSKNFGTMSGAISYSGDRKAYATGQRECKDTASARSLEG